MNFGYWSIHNRFHNFPDDSAVYKTTTYSEYLNQLPLLAIEYFDDLEFTKKSNQKIILIADPSVKIKATVLEKLKPDYYVDLHNFKFNHFLEFDEIRKTEEQDLVYLHLASELNTEYEIIKKELESKIKEQQLDLIENRQKLLEANNRSESLRKILYALHQESDIPRIETLLNELLPSTTQTTWVKIIPQNQKNAFQTDLKKQLDLGATSLDVLDYVIFFIRGDKKNFKKSDIDLFHKIKDVLTLNIQRGEHLKNLILAEKILDTAFQSINLPMAIIDHDYTVINSNKKFNLTTSATQTKCYEMFFNQNQPCIGCQRGQKTVLKINDQTFDVDSKIYQKTESMTLSYINTYKNISEKILLENRMTQNAKLNDLGLISSSIAHELNNPLGGIISYLQMIQLDLDQKSPIYNDIQDMLLTSAKIKKIIEDLLIFSRRPTDETQISSNLQDFIQTVLSANELVLKAENIKVVLPQDFSNVSVSVSPMQFKHSLHLILLFFIERFRSSSLNKKQGTGLLEVQYTNNKLLFAGNFGPLESDFKSKDVQFLTIHKTLINQGLQVELIEKNKTWVEVEMTFQKS